MLTGVFFPTVRFILPLLLLTLYFRGDSLARVLEQQGFGFRPAETPIQAKTVTASGASGKARASGKACDWVRREKLREKCYGGLFYFILFYFFLTLIRTLYTCARVCVFVVLAKAC